MKGATVFQIIIFYQIKLASNYLKGKKGFKMGLNGHAKIILV